MKQKTELYQQNMKLGIFSTIPKKKESGFFIVCSISISLFHDNSCLNKKGFLDQLQPFSKMFRASLTRPCSNGVFSVTYFSTKTSNESFLLGGLPFKFSICSSCVLSVCRSRSERRETCAEDDFSGLLRCLLDGKLSSISKS